MSFKVDPVAAINTSNSQKVWKIRVRVVRLWRSPDRRNPQAPDFIDMVLVDAKNDSIQCTVWSDQAKNFEGLLREGMCYEIVNPSVALNSYKFKPTLHPCRLYFRGLSTTVKPIEDPMIPIYGLNFTDYKTIFESPSEESKLVDVIGVVTSRGEPSVYTSGDKSSPYIVVELNDLRGEKNMVCTLWEDFAKQFLQYIEEGHNVPVIIILKLARMKFFRGQMGVCNTNYNSKLLINHDIPEVHDLHTRSSGNAHDLDDKIVKDLKHMLDAENRLVQSYRYARERYKDGTFSNVKLRLIRRRDKDGRTYNLPTTSEVAALVVGDFEPSVGRELIVETQSKKLKIVDINHPSFLALQYPLLFPYGEDGFREGILTKDVKTSTRKKEDISIREFFAYRLQDRDGESPIVLQSRRLFQQFLVDSYTMVETDRMQYYRFNQHKLRVERYKGLHESLVRGETNAAATGQRIILPSPFTGGPRYMFNNCKDSFAICRHLGYPSLFITMTCNPEWPEIKRFVEKRGLKPEDRPDILCRVFKVKLEKLIHDFKSGNVFGKISGYTCTIEFQKRGLPHAHILLFVHTKFKPKTPDDIDKIISAEIPDINKDPELCTAVQRYMIHGPCGAENFKSPCMSNGKCSKHFPKEFRIRTVMDDDGFPKYRKRDDGRTVKKGKSVLDNRYVVPYNPVLLKKYGAHINVEYTCQTSAIKYLFKYVHKGNDRATAALYQTRESATGGDVIDEVKNYYDCRYISACEAAWRLFEYKIHYREPAGVTLPFHLPDEQGVVYRDSDAVQDATEKANMKKSKFMGWMEANKVYADGRKITYEAYPTRFVWKAENQKWDPRQQGFSIGRISHVRPTCGEDYYMRLLLNVQKGCTSYKDIRTANQVTYNTYQEACYALGLLQDDNNLVKGIKEASLWATGEYLRRLFAILLISNNISRPEDLWNKCWQELSDDILYKQKKKLDYKDLTLTDDQKKNLTLAEIEELLQKNGRSLHNFPSMPFPSKTYVADCNERMIVEELNYDRIEMCGYLDRALTSITDEQRHAYDKIISAVYGNKGGFFFLYGYGGTGKTFLWNTLSASVRSRGDIVINVASSGIASLLLPGGRTAHSRFRIPIPISEDSTCNIKHNSPHAKLLIRAKLIIWDEAPMMSKWCYEALDKCFKDILRFTPGYDSHMPFGGKVVVLGGDFRQILPVIQGASRQDIVSAAINSSYLWPFCEVLSLTKNMRLLQGSSTSNASDIAEFSKWLLDIGDGKVGEPINGESEIKIPEEILIQNSNNGFEDLVNFTYPNLLQNIETLDYFKERAILTPTVELVGKVNDNMMTRVPGLEREYLSSDEICKEDVSIDSELDAFSPEVLNAINCSGLPPHKLTLKKHVPVILLRNIDQANGLCNGTRLQVRRTADHVIECVVLTGTKVGQVALIPRIKMVTSNSNLPFKFQRTQFPISICFGMTINKSQGQTLGCVGLYLPRPVFTHGQLYVALSRVTSKQGLRILIENHDDLPPNTTVNVVYEEVFANIKP